MNVLTPLSKAAWQRAVVLQLLSRAGLPCSLPQMGAALECDHTTIAAHLRVLMELGAAGRERTSDGRWRYFASQIVRMAAAE